MTAIRVHLIITGASLLQRHRLLQPSKRVHGRHLALLAAAFAALKLHPPQLFQALGELFKQQRYVLGLLGPQESMLLLWAFARVQHMDAPAQLLLIQRAVTQASNVDWHAARLGDCRSAAVVLIKCSIYKAVLDAKQQLMQPSTSCSCEWHLHCKLQLTQATYVMLTRASHHSHDAAAGWPV